MNYFSHFLTQTYVVGAQKNRLFKTVLLSSQNICLNEWVRKKSHIYCQNFAYLNLCVYKFIFNYFPSQENRINPAVSFNKSEKLIVKSYPYCKSSVRRVLRHLGFINRIRPQYGSESRVSHSCQNKPVCKKRVF